MTPDKIEKAIQFLLDQQPAFEASLRKTRELFQEGWEKTQAQFRETDAHIRQVSKQTETNSEQIRLLKDACRDLLEHAGYTDFRLNRLENPEV